MNIKEISEQERPRERLMKYGPKTLSNAELLAIILRQGSKKESVLELSHRLLGMYTLKSLSRLKTSTLKKIFGMGDAKSCQITACFELGRRLAAFSRERRVRINCAKDVARLFLPELSTLKQEHCLGIYLDSRRRMIKEETIFVGSLNASVVHPREIFEIALSEGAAAFILVHNHPSGDPTPSEEDILVTTQLHEAGTIMGIELLDHIIIGQKTYCSLREKGLF